MLIRLILLLFYCLGISTGQNRKHLHFDNENCGKRLGRDNSSPGVSVSKSGKFPWHVGVYKYDNTSKAFEQICGGTIIAPHIVLTAASCVTDAATTLLYQANFIRIIAGKLAVNWTTGDSNSQEIYVSNITVPETYLGDLNYNAENIAVLNLSNDLHFNNFVLPACFGLNNKLFNIEERYLQTAGWGFNSGIKYKFILKEAKLQYISVAECRKNISTFELLSYINYDKFCVETPRGIKYHDIGGGLVYKKDNRYHLVGIISDKINNQISTVTNISRHLNWLSSTLDELEKTVRCEQGDLQCVDGGCVVSLLVCDGTTAECEDGTDETPETCPPSIFGNRTKSSCFLPNLPGGVSYTKKHCDPNVNNCELKGGVFVEESEEVRINCGQGFAHRGRSKPEYLCSRGRLHVEDPECIKLCSPLKTPNVNFQCSYNRRDISCDRFMRPGTVAKYNCSLHYTLADRLAFKGNMTCGEKGFWKDPIPICNPDCGIENPGNLLDLRLSFTSVSKHGLYPWHVGIYRVLENGTFVNLCGGTLINEHMVLTAAHCVSNESGVIMKEGDLRVAAGKYYRSWDSHETTQKTSYVKNILIPETYEGNWTHFEEDIALLNTEDSFKYSDYILPACLDYSSSLNVLDIKNISGTMVGWGATEDGEFSEELRELKLPILSTVPCRRKFKPFISFITSDKFCVLFEDGKSVEKGDSGGAITVKNNGRHFIYGVISYKPENENSFAVMTNTSHHFDWLKNTISNYYRSNV